jgi:hypothetical protein
MARCALCQQYRLLVKSHIFPEWMYECLYDERGFFYIVSFGTE